MNRLIMLLPALLICILSIVFGLFTFSYLYELNPTKKFVLSHLVSDNERGGRCYFNKLYDSNGRGYIFNYDFASYSIDKCLEFSTDSRDAVGCYSSQAPLYYFPSSELVAISSLDDNIKLDNCGHLPDKISPKLAIRGNPHYPLVIKRTIRDDGVVKQGESTVFSIITTYTDTYLLDEPQRELLFALPRAEIGCNEYGFKLLTANFESSYKKGSIQTIRLCENKPAEIHWLLSPSQGASGIQSAVLMFGVQFENTDPGKYESYYWSSYTFDIRVINKYGIQPILYGVVVAIFIFIMGLLTLLKLLPETLSAWIDLIKKKHAE